MPLSAKVDAPTRKRYVVCVYPIGETNLTMMPSRRHHIPLKRDSIDNTHEVLAAHEAGGGA
jgi:hypothetical protein